jgi:hypothetical protein
MARHLESFRYRLGIVRPILLKDPSHRDAAFGPMQWALEIDIPLDLSLSKIDTKRLLNMARQIGRAFEPGCRRWHALL